MTDRPINPRALEYFEDRGLDPELISRMGIYTVRPTETGSGEVEYLPDATGNVIAFPYFERGVEVNTKYRSKNRDGSRRFWQRKGARKTFFNSDVIDDPQVQAGDKALVITEGEPDALAAIQAGWPWSVSVPDGAPAARDEKGNVIPMKPDKELNPSEDAKFEFILNNWERLRKVRKFILATDGDEPGERLRDELARRLGRASCYFVVYPEEAVVPDGKGGVRRCKDLNEVALYFDDKKAMEVILGARPYPVQGLFRLSDFAGTADTFVTYSTGFPCLDDLVRLYEGATIIVSGVPGHGKSALVNQIAYNTAAQFGWPWAICSFEAPIAPIIRNQLRGFALRRRQSEWDAEMIRDADAFIERQFCFITQSPDRRGEEVDVTVPWLVDRIYDAVLRYGIKGAIVDPWNELDHFRRQGQSEAEYLNEAIKDIKRCAAATGVCFLIAAHPTKDAGDAVNSGNAMGLYDINGGAAWANKAELGLIVHRDGDVTKIINRKVKFAGTGKIGEEYLTFRSDLRMFEDETAPKPGSDRRNVG